MRPAGDAPKRAVDAVVFDYGAVICRLPSADEWREFAEAAGTRVEEFIRTYPCSRERYDRGLVRAEEFWREFGSRAGRDYDPDGIRRLGEIDIRVWSHIDDDLVALACELRRAGVVTGILSNMQPDLLDSFRRGAAWLDAFDVHLFSCDVGFIKPERQIYDLLVSRLRMPPARVLFVDDVPDNVEGAKAAGLQAARFTSVADLRCLLDSSVFGGTG